MRVKTCQFDVKAAGEQDGTDAGEFEAVVATYDLDSYGDKIIPGAFKDTLAEWKAKGDPIPVIWSHMSYDPDMHLGVVEDAEERDAGLWVRGRLDLDQPKAAQVYRLMKGRRVTQFSFAYDVLEGAWIEEKDADPYYELRKLKLYEVGPTLIGVNQETELLAVKSADGRDLQVAVRGGRLSPTDADTVRLAVETALGAKAGRVLSAKNETTLKDAVDKLTAGVKDVKAVLAAVASDSGDDEKSTPASNTQNDETSARPGQAVTDEDPTAGKSDRPAALRSADVRLLADLRALAAEID